MTTIVATRTEIACDLQVTYNGRQPLKVDTKIEKFDGPIVSSLWGAEEAYIGYAGTVNDWGNVLAWFRDPNMKVPKIKDAEFLALTNKKQIWYSSNFNNWTVFKEPYAAIGSGSQFAIGALSSGLSPKEAIKVATKHDVFTGMGCKSYSF
jgi:ATP-dependent protease HslVU (ClpYQ) peptidase subunit